MKGLKKHPLIAVLNREIERIKHNPAYRFLLFSGPLVGILLLFFMFHEGVAQKLPVAIVDQDNSTLSAQIKNAINSSPDVEVVAGSHNVFQAREWLKQGRIQAFILLPNNLEKKAIQGVEAPVPVYINGTNVTVAGVVQRSLLTTLNTISGGIQLKKLALAGNNGSKAMARIVPVKIQKHVLFNPYVNYSYFLSSAMLYFTLFLFAFMSSVYTFGNELKRGTGLNLLETGNNSIRLTISGKLIPYSLIFSGFAMFIVYLLYVVEGMPLNGNFLLIFFGQFITILAYQVLGLLFVTITKNLRLALSLGSAYVIMGITFSGLTFPTEGMTTIVKAFTVVFPFTWWEKLVISQSLRGAPLKEALPYMVYILSFIFIGVASFKTYKNSLGNPKYWGKQ